MVAWALPAVTGTYIWVGIFDPDDGVVRRLFDLVGLFPGGSNWFTDRISFYAIAGLNVVHHGYPFIAITIFAGLTTIPPELHEAAKIEGGSAIAIMLTGVLLVITIVYLRTMFQENELT